MFKILTEFYTEILTLPSYLKRPLSILRKLSKRKKSQTVSKAKVNNTEREKRGRVKRNCLRLMNNSIL